jgi:hypothetical protein
MSARCHDNKRSYPSSPKEKGSPNIDGVHVGGGKTLIPVVNSNGLTYAIVVSIPIENNIYIYIYT